MQADPKERIHYSKLIEHQWFTETDLSLKKHELFFSGKYDTEIILAPPGIDFADIDKKLKKDSFVLLNSKGVKLINQEQNEKVKMNVEEFSQT